ncbi:MAG: hypothetical protein H6729_00115 [Deltaproteobacteria bacterium]|nr:hypothetical protein [Deltaproteobacteria bacterium]
MAEPYVINISSEADFDGTTLMDVGVNDFDHNGRILSIAVPGPVGIIPATFFGLFAATAPKLVGVANDTWNPLNLALVDSDGPVATRAIATLRPQIQHLSLFGNDRLVVRTRNGGRSSLYLTINALSERDHVDLALRQQQRPAVRRYRIRRSGSAGWTAAAGATALVPVWAYESAKGILAADVNQDGPFPISAFLPKPEIRGAYVSVRFSGTTGPNFVYAIDGEQRRAFAVHNALPEMQWSKVIYMSADDHIMFATPAPVGGFQAMVELEVIPIKARDRFVGRFDNDN